MGMFDAVIRSAQAQHRGDTNLAMDIGKQFGAGIEQGRRKRQLVDAQLEAFADAGMIEPDEFNKLSEGNLRAKADKVLELEAFRSLQDEELKRENLESQIGLRGAQAALAGAQVEDIPVKRLREAEKFKLDQKFIFYKAR